MANLLGCLLIIATGSKPVAVSKLFDATTKDFGNVPYGSVNIHRFVLHNTTGSALHLAGMRSTCRCATAEADRYTVKPNEKLTVKVTYDARKFVGPKSMTIYVSFDRPQQKTVALHIQGNSQSDVSIEPGFADFGAVTSDEAIARSVRIHHRTKPDWKISDVAVTEGLAASVRPEPVSKGTAYVLQVRLEPGLPEGNFSGRVRLATNDKSSRQISVEVQARIEGRIEASPSTLRMGVLAQGERVSRKILLRADAPFHVTKVTGAEDRLDVHVDQEDKLLQIVTVTFKTNDPGATNVILKLRTSLPDSKPVSIPVSAFVTKLVK